MAYVHKDPSSHDCEDLTLRIELPGTGGMGELDLDVKETVLKLRSPVYKLNLYLPHKVDDKKGSAKWDSKTEVLKVTLPIIRDGEWEL